MPIHPTAIVDTQAEIDPSAEIGPYAIIEGPVQVSAGVKVLARAHVSGWTRLGEGCEIHMGAVVGHVPQDRAFTGERSYCEIGRRAILREYVTVHRGTMPESKTVIGDDCFLLAGAHVGHNCVLGERATLMNCALLAGHVQVGPGAVLSAGAIFHQFVRVGDLVMVSGGSQIVVDVPPFLTVYERGLLVGVNRIGMLRAKMPREDIDEIRAAFRTLYRSRKPLSRTIPQLAERVVTPAGRRLVEFLQADHKRPLARARERSHAEHPGEME